MIGACPEDVLSPEVFRFLEGIAYLAGRDGTLLCLGGRSWLQLVGDGRSCPDDGYVGRSLFEIIQGDEVREAYRHLHATAARVSSGLVAFDFRCDTPGARQYMRLSMSGLRDGHVLYHSQLLHSEPRVPLPLLSDPARARSGAQIVTICSYCQDVAWPAGSTGPARRWIPAEDYYRAGGSADVRVSHGICAGCYDRVIGTV